MSLGPATQVGSYRSPAVQTALRTWPQSPGFDVSDAVQVVKRDKIATIVISRPLTRNAIDRATAQLLADAVRSIESDTDVHVGVLWGASGTFSSGADLHAIHVGRANRLERSGDAPLGPTRLLTRKPFIAAIAGYAVAGGLELALWCDLRVVEDSAKLGVFCRRWGVPLIDGGTMRLPRLIGLSRALDLILTGRAVDAKEAYAMGLANRVVPDGSSREHAEALANQLAAFPQECMLADRRSAYEAFHPSVEEALTNEFDRALPTMDDAMRRGVAAFARGAGRSGTMDPA